MGDLNWALLNDGADGNALVSGIQAGQQQRAYNRKAALEENALAGRQKVANALASGDNEGAMREAVSSGNVELVGSIAQMSKAQRDMLDRKMDKFGTFALGLKQLPQEQWGAAFEAAKPTLKAAGFTDEELAKTPLTPQGLDAAINGAMTLKDHLAQANSDRTYNQSESHFAAGQVDKQLDRQQRKEIADANNAVQIRGQNRAAADAAAGREVTLAGQRTNAEGRELQNEKIRGEIADKTRAREGAGASFDVAIDTLKELRNHPGLEKTVGLTTPFLNDTVPFVGTIPGTDRADFEAKLNTFQAQTFLPQVQALKGAGALSDAEGAKLTAAVGALNPNMSEKAFRASLDKIEQQLTAARDRAVATNATAAPRQQNFPNAPKVGFVLQGYRFKGGDPAASVNWEKVKP